jgi:hypothetical protein
MMFTSNKEVHIMIDGTITIKTRDFEPDTCTIEYRGADNVYLSKTTLEINLEKDLAELIHLIKEDSPNTIQKLLTHSYTPF